MHVLLTGMTFSILVGSISYFNDVEKSFGNIFAADKLDLGINGWNSFNGTIINISNGKEHHIYYAEATLQISGNIPATIKLKFFNLSCINGCSEKNCIAKHIEIGINIVNTSTGEVYHIINLSEHKTLWDLQNQWIDLARGEIFTSSVVYILNVSIYFNLSLCEKNINFGIEFLAEQYNGGFKDIEISYNNRLQMEGENG